MSRSPENARPTGSPPLIEKVSLSSQIYLSIREGIILGRYPQGSRLTEQRLAQEFEVSRIPLREAVPLLDTELPKLSFV